MPLLCSRRRMLHRMVNANKRLHRSSSSFVAAVVQAAPVFMDKSATTAKACDLIAASAAKGASVVAFPESFLPAFPYGAWHHGVKRNMAFHRELFLNACTLDDPCVSTVGAADKDDLVRLLRAS